MTELEKLTSNSTDEGLHRGDENAHPDPDSPKKQKQLILIRLIKSHLKFCCALLTPWLPGLTPGDLGGLGRNLGLRWQEMELFVLLFWRWQKASQGDLTGSFPKHKNLVVPPHGRLKGDTPGQDGTNPIPCWNQHLRSSGCKSILFSASLRDFGKGLVVGELGEKWRAAEGVVLLYNTKIVEF